MGVPESDKALRYIQQLDDARCAGRWKDIPELCRKVEKHAPNRPCLTLTARSEAHIAAYSMQRPATAASSTSSSLSKIIPSLLTAIDDEEDHVQDAFQATICLGWLHHVLEEPGLAVARLPKDFAAVAEKMSSGASLSGWSRVCIVKGAFLKGSSHEKIGAIDDALHSYASVLPWLCSIKFINNESLQFKMWTEHLLVRLCQLSNVSSELGDLVEPRKALQAYRFWAKYWESIAKSNGSEGANAARYRRLAWKAYYDSLSAILRHGLPYEPESAVSDNEKPSFQMLSGLRLQQRAELHRVEAIYESLLLKETHFPKASDSNREIEAWADAVMDNWRFLCGPTWSDKDLGEGGKEAVSRSVLDILYRAATKTFHSTQLLRHLFTVHASLAEFDLAFKAYESYVEIIARGKDRMEKSGEEDASIDDDNTILRTSSEAIRLLCRFGSRTDAEKALDVANHIEKWLEQIEHIKAVAPETGSIGSADTMVEPRSLAIAYCAIGISQAHWARMTYDANARSSFQTKAIQYLRKSLGNNLGEPYSLDAHYALALVLAETRDILGAIKVVKRALSPMNKNQSSMSADGVISIGVTTNFGRERKLIPIWHLLALLLTARSEYSAAEKACEAAFEQFGDPTILFGKDDANAYRSEHLNEASGKYDNVMGVVDQMENFEKSGILQIKMTQLSLVEVIDGADAAVDGCDELLALYTRLFGDQSIEQIKLQSPITAVPPKSAVGTIRGSIFRSKGTIKNTQENSSARNSSIMSSRPLTVSTQVPTTPAIQVTDEDGSRHTKSHHHLFHHRYEEERPGVTRVPSKLQKRSANSLRRRSEADVGEAPEVPELPESVSNANGTPTRASTVYTKSPRRSSVSSSGRKSVESSDRPLRPIAHNMSHSMEPRPPGHSHQPPKQDTRLPAPFPHANYIPPDPHFPTIQERRQKVSLLVDIWIYISRLYTQADMFDDAKEAVTEALKLVETIEGEVSQESSTSKALANGGWGGGKSVEELWADAFAARGKLLAAQSVKHEARADFERACIHYPNHPEAIIGLGNILLDIYCKVVSLEPSKHPDAVAPLTPDFVPPISDSYIELKKQNLSSHTPSAENQLSPPELNRLAARDRAYGLLSTLTKLGSGWDFPEAWYALARAYEESGEIEKTKQVLWWCVELEDTQPIRHWKSVTLGGFVL